MADKVEMMRRKMERTRASLARKLDRLGDKTIQPISDTVEDVTDTVANVKESVNSMSRFLNVSKQVKKHPWAVVGGSVAAGFLAGLVLNRIAPSSPSTNGIGDRRYAPPEADSSVQSNGSSQRKQEPDSSWLGSLVSKFTPSLETVKSLAIGASFGVARDLIARNLPDDWSGEVRNVFDDATEKAGGKTVKSTVPSSQ